MTSTELGEFVGKVRRLFGGEMDEELWAIARQRIAQLRAKPAFEALDEYALAHGGGRSRFIPGKFLEFYGRRDIARDEIDAGAKRRAAAKALDEIRTVGAVDVKADWENVLSGVRRLPLSERSRIVALLVSHGWSAPDSDPARWSRSWLLAVADIARGDRLPALDYETMTWTRMVEPIEVWGPIGKAARIAREASARADPSGTAAERGRLGEPGNAVSGDPAPIGAAMADDDEIPF